MDTPPSQRIYTDNELLVELCQIAQDVMGYPDEENSWYYSTGCLLGNLSVHVFSSVPEEYQQWEAEQHLWQGHYEREMAQARNTEALATIALQGYSNRQWGLADLVLVPTDWRI